MKDDERGVLRLAAFITLIVAVEVLYQLMH